MIPLTPAVRRAAALAILALIVVVVWTILVGPVVSLSADRRADIADLSDQLARLKAMAARQPELEARARQAEARFASSSGFWTGASPAAVAAGMQDLVRQAAAGGQVRSASEGAEKTEHGFRQVSVRFQLEGPLETLEHVLAAIDAARPSLFVDTITLRANPSFARERPPTITADLTLIGFMEPPKS